MSLLRQDKQTAWFDLGQPWVPKIQVKAHLLACEHTYISFLGNNADICMYVCMSIKKMYSLMPLRSYIIECSLHIKQQLFKHN